MNYGKIVDGRLVLAPKALGTGAGLVLNPAPAQYAAAGWLPVLDAARPPKGPGGGRHLERDGWRAAPGGIVPRWRLVKDAAPAPRAFSKLRVVAALQEAGLWPQVKAWIEEQGLTDLYLAAQDFAEDNPLFKQGLAALQPALGLSGEQVEAILAKCAREGA